VTAAAVYLRVSSKDGRQDETNQEPPCLALCAARGWTAKVLREQESGAKKRPVWDSVKDDCRRGTYRAVVFWALDRIGRNRVQVAHDVAELARWGVQIVSVQDAWLDQPAGPLRDLLLQIMAWVAEGERARLIERTRAGQARARAAGRLPGRPRADRTALETGARLARAGMSLSRAADTVKVARATLRTYMAKNGGPTRPGAPTVLRGV
jgi:DNA invertase Pin-like site-specific DNA recombinase